MGADRGGDCGIWICDWTVRDCYPAVVSVAGASGEDGGDFSVAGFLYDCFWGPVGGGGIDAVSQDAGTVGFWDV